MRAPQQRHKTHGLSNIHFLVAMEGTRPKSTSHRSWFLVLLAVFSHDFTYIFHQKKRRGERRGEERELLPVRIPSKLGPYQLCLPLMVNNSLKILSLNTVAFGVRTLDFRENMSPPVIGRLGRLLK